MSNIEIKTGDTVVATAETEAEAIKEAKSLALRKGERFTVIVDGLVLFQVEREGNSKTLIGVHRDKLAAALVSAINHAFEKKRRMGEAPITIGSALIAVTEGRFLSARYNITEYSRRTKWKAPRYC